MTQDAPQKPENPPQPKAEPAPDKVTRLTDEALDAGSRITQSQTGRKVADAADDVFEKAEELTRKALDSEVGQKVTAAAQDLHKKALETTAGRKIADTAEDLSAQAMNSDAGVTARKIWNTPLGRNVGTGAAAGAAIGVVLPIVGPLIGAVLGGGLGYLRTLAKKSKPD